jgi:hypothetical protein
MHSTPSQIGRAFAQQVAEERKPHNEKRPLRRELPPALHFPLDALGYPLHGAAWAITDMIQCPVAIAAMSVLGAASLAAQAHADVLLPATNHAKPLSLFLVTVAASGERKSAADHEALRPIRMYEALLLRQYKDDLARFNNLDEAWKAARERAKRAAKGDFHATTQALESVGVAPAPPLTPMLTCPEPTFEGLCRLYASGHPALGIFSDEGGQFVGGHGLSDESRLRTIAGLSSLWDGSPIRRVRAADGAYTLPGRRLALHLMMQPGVASSLLSDPVLTDQGFLSRILVSAPHSTAGTRLQRSPDARGTHMLSQYSAQLQSVLERAPSLAAGSANELCPRHLVFDPAAADVWRKYADYVERQLGSGQPYEPIRGLANKLPEHAARIAAVLTIVENVEAATVSEEKFSCACRLTEYFAGEALRLFDAGAARPHITTAEKLLSWWQAQPETAIHLTQIYQRGPNGLRDAESARRAVQILEEHGLVQRLAPGAEVEGRSRRDAWTLVA